MTSLNAKTLAALPMIAKVSAWNDRVYVTLANVSRSANSDIRTKIWAKGDTLTVETGKGYNSSEFISDLRALQAAVVEMGGKFREI